MNEPTAGYLRPCMALLFLFLFSPWAFSQNIRIKGAVRSDEGPVRGVSVTLKSDPSRGAVTDVHGAFTLTVPPGSTLVFSHVGFRRQEVQVKDQSALDILLVASESALSDVVIVGYGKQKAPTVTGAVSTVTGADLVQTPVSNVSNMLVGRTSGLSSVQSSGEPGQNAANIYIRGIATLNGTNPLIVIDGIQQPAEQPFVVMNAMDANEIESISILKDASATAVYGIRGANGVIIITTKRGQSGRPHFSFSANQALTRATSLLQTIGSYEFGLFRNEGIANADTYGDHSFDNYLFSSDQLWKFQHDRDYTPAEVSAMSFLTPQQQTALNNSPALYYSSHNYYQQQFGGTGKQQQYNLNVSGGTSRARYFTSLGYFHQAGILANTNYGGSNTNSDFQRYNFRSNMDIDVFKNFQLSVNLAGQSSISKGPGLGDNGDRYQNIIQNILESSPFSGPGIVDGKLVTSFVGLPGAATNPISYQGGTGVSPVSQLLTSGIYTQYITTLTSNVTLRHNMSYLTSGLNAHVTVSYDDSYTKGYYQQNNVPQYAAMRDPSDPLNIDFIGGQLNPSSTSDNLYNSAWRKVYFEGAIDYKRSFGGHDVSALVLANAQRYTDNTQSFNTPSGLMGLVGRATYDFREKYLAEFDLGYNGTENFAPGHRFGTFPAVSGGWIVSKESFFPKNDWVTWVKLRGSYGEVGNDQLYPAGSSTARRYLYLPNTWSYSGNGYWFGNSNGSSSNTYYSGALETSLGNPDVTWERAKKVNLSADLKFVKDKLSVTASDFWENRDNILVTLQTIPGIYGVPASNVPPANVGRVSNKGFELEAGWNDRIGKLSYFLKGNFSYARNKIQYMAEPSYPYPWMDQTGYPIGQYKGLKFDGFFNTQEEINNRPYNTFGNMAKLGDIRYKDINGDGQIDSKDQVPIGYANVPEVAFNLNVGFSYMGFDFSALFNGTAKGSFPQSGYILSTPFAKNVGEVLQQDYDGHWTAEKYAKGEKITYPEFSFNGSGPNNEFSDFWLKANDFKRLKNVEVGYSFQNRAFLKRTGVKGLRIYANGNNLFTWGTHMLKGIDPELADSGKNYMGYIYPLTRTFNFGANIQF